MKRLILGLISSVVTVNTFAAVESNTRTTVANVASHRMHSVTHSNGKAHNMYMMYIKGLKEDCKSLYLYADRDPYLFAAALSALNSPKTKNLLFYYHTGSDARGPWGDTSSCRLTSITVMPSPDISPVH